MERKGQVNARTAIMLERYKRDAARHAARVTTGAAPISLTDDTESAELIQMRSRMNKAEIARRQSEYRSPVTPMDDRDLENVTIVRVCDENTPERVAEGRRNLLVAREGAAHRLFNAGYLSLGGEGRDAVNRVSTVRNARAALARAESRAGVESNELVSA